MESGIRDLYKAQAIIGADYSEYPNPLRNLLDTRKRVYIIREDLRRTEEIDAVIECYEDQIKLLLCL